MKFTTITRLTKARRLPAFRVSFDRGGLHVNGKTVPPALLVGPGFALGIPGIPFLVCSLLAYSPEWAVLHLLGPSFLGLLLVVLATPVWGLLLVVLATPVNHARKHISWKLLAEGFIAGVICYWMIRSFIPWEVTNWDQAFIPFWGAVLIGLGFMMVPAWWRARKCQKVSLYHY